MLYVIFKNIVIISLLLFSRVFLESGNSIYAETLLGLLDSLYC